jgi:hypothetical protein
MASSINASTSGAGGVITSADNSGILNLQSGGNTIATVQSTGFSLPASATINAANTFGFKNRIINGGMTISQYNGTSSVTAANATYILDRWVGNMTVAGKFTAQQSSTAPTGFINSLLLTSTSAYTLATGEFVATRQLIEGLNVSDLAWGTASAKAVTLSFWVQSSVTGTFGGTLANSASNRVYVFSYSISSANTWTQISITIAGDTSGTWLTTTGVGIGVRFCIGAASDYQGTPGSWGTTSYTAPTGQTSLVATNGATFYITGVQLEVGSQATSFDFRDYGRELNLCQRYYQALVEGGGYFHSGSAISTSQVRGPRFTFFQTMRTTPTITLPTAGTGAGQMYYCQSSGAATSVGNFTPQQIKQDSFFLEGETWTGVLLGGASLLAAGSGGITIAISAEL